VLKFVEPPVQRREVFGLVTFTHKPLVWPADGGEPDPIEHGRQHRLPRDPDGIPSARSRSLQCEPGITRKRAVVAGGHRAAPHAGQHLPRSAGAVPGKDARRRHGSRRRAAARAGSTRRVRSPGPITVSAALNTSRCRTQAESAGRADRRLMAEPRRKRRHAKPRKAKQNIRIGMSPVAAGAAVSGVPVRRLSEAAGVYAAPDQDVYGVDIWLNTDIPICIHLSQEHRAPLARSAARRPRPRRRRPTTRRARPGRSASSPRRPSRRPGRCNGTVDTPAHACAGVSAKRRGASNSRESNMSLRADLLKSGLTAALRKQPVEIPAPTPSQHRIGKATIGG